VVGEQTQLPLAGHTTTSDPSAIEQPDSGRGTWLLQFPQLLVVLLVGVAIPFTLTKRHVRQQVTRFRGLWSRASRRLSKTVVIDSDQ
jgi:hypothetical protein